MRRIALLISLVASATLAAPPPAAPEPFTQATLFRAGEGNYNNYRIPSVICTPRGTVLAFCEGRQTPYGPGNDTGEINLIVRRSTDMGETFSAPQVVWADGPNTCGNPCPVIDESTGTIWLLMTHNLGRDHEKDIIAGKSKGTRTVWVTHSRDDGVTWAQPRQITATTKKPGWAWYATGPGVGIQIKHGPRAGRLVIPCDYIADGGGPGAGNAHIIYSDDHGQTWQLGGESPVRNFNESQIVELTDGRLMLNMRNYGPSRGPQSNLRGTTISTDGGATFGSVRHDPDLVEPKCQASILRYSWPADGDRSRILFANPASTKERKRMTVRLSFDEATTWPASRTLFEGWSCYSSLVHLPNGRVGLLYEAGDKQRYERIDFARFTLDWLTEHQGAPAASRDANRRP